MSLKEQKILFIDCQTTGIRPPAAHLLEIAWGTPGQDASAHLISLPEGTSFPRVVTEITGLTADSLADAVAIADVAEKFRMVAGDIDAAVIHYAQFEKPFLLDLLNRLEETGELPFRVLCTHQIIKRLLPNLPSQNIRACAGFFGPAVTGLNRAATFVRATEQIWTGLIPQLEEQGLKSAADVEAWLKKSPRAKSTRYEYRLDKVKRLELPDQPGVYRMLSKSGEVLYVGKATSLKSRVNSYFRGKKGRDPRKLEMLAQVWDLQVTPCPTPLEAALLESDEIKRLNPPYNVVLKTGRRHLVFYNHDFSASSRSQSREFPIGPFRNSNWIEHLRLLKESLEGAKFRNVFYEPFPEEAMREGFRIFCEQHGLKESDLHSVRTQLAVGLNLYRNYVEPEEEITIPEVNEDAEPASIEEVLADDEIVLTPEDLAGKFERLLRRAGEELWRTRELTRLLDAKVQLNDRTLEFRSGHLDFNLAPKPGEKPWSGLEVDTYDRMSILLSELKRAALRL